MSNSSSKGGSIQSILAAAVIPIAIGIGFAIWKFIMGDPSGFEDGDINKTRFPTISWPPCIRAVFLFRF